jgi:hypothetical protein
MKIALLIPSRSTNTWVLNPLIIKTIHSIGETISDEHDYTIFLGYDEDDVYYNNDTNVTSLSTTAASYNMSVELIKLNVERGHLTKMWNVLTEIAYNKGFDYFYMTGDDIVFNTQGWVNESIATLESTENIGMTGPVEITNPRILTQCFVHKTHYEIFKYLLPEEIKNWYCDDWMNCIYDVKRIDEKYTCHNLCGAERYSIVHCPEILGGLVERDKKKIAEYKETRDL